MNIEDFVIQPSKSHINIPDPVKSVEALIELAQALSTLLDTIEIVETEDDR